MMRESKLRQIHFGIYVEDSASHVEDVDVSACFTNAREAQRQEQLPKIDACYFQLSSKVDQTLPVGSKRPQLGALKEVLQLRSLLKN